jgi:thiamine biosynthesis lipoprotein
MTEEESRATLGVGGDGPVPGAHRFSHAAMATVFEVHCVHAEARYAGQAAQAAFDEVDRLERELSRFAGNSDVSRINGLAAGESTRVSPSTMECLEIARVLYDLTNRAFDVSVGTGLDSLELDPDAFVVRAGTDGVRLDLGGIGKGYAVDRMGDVMEEWEVPRGLVHGGFSSVLALEAPPEREGWPLTLSAPGPGPREILARLSARQVAFSASGTQKGAHVLDPRTGAPVRDRAAWVSLPRGAGAAEESGGPTRPGAVAEGLSTAFMILPAEEAAGVCERCPGLEAWLLREPEEEGRPAALLHLVAPLADGRPRRAAGKKEE